MSKENNANVLDFEAATKVINDLIGKAPELKLTESESKTGFSYFAGKKRLCKILKSKRGVRIELNVKLPKKLSDLPEVDTISKEMAHKKHLGTMKHLFRGSDDKLVKEVLTAAIASFKQEVLPKAETKAPKENKVKEA